jgi:hypothetical protein
MAAKPWIGSGTFIHWAMNTTSRRVRPSPPSPQADLFTAPDDLPEGFCYRPSILACDGADALSRELVDLPFKPFDFRGYRANRQVVTFGYRYDYDGRAVLEASPFPAFLVSLRDKIAAVFDRPAEAFRQVLMNQYRPGAGIGWHRDKTLAHGRATFGYLLSRPAHTVGSRAFRHSTSFVIQLRSGH